MIWALAIVLALGVSPAYADIYKYIDETGAISFSDTPVRGAKRVVPGQEEDNKNPTFDLHDVINKKCEQYDMDPALVNAVIKTESNYNASAISRKGAIGLMQLMPSTAYELEVKNPFDPEQNIDGGVRYLRYLIDRFGDLRLALAAYNAGPGRVETYGTIPPIKETKQYVKKVLAIYNPDRQASVVRSATAPQKREKPVVIYKIVLEDGTILYTNSSEYNAKGL